MRPTTVKALFPYTPSVPSWIGELSGGRSATVPTFVRSRSRRTKIEWQKLHVVCTAPDQRNVTRAPQLGQLAEGALIGNRLERPLDAPHAHRLRGELAFQVGLEIPVRTRPAAEDVQAKRMILGKRVAGNVRFSQQIKAGYAAGAGKLVPGGFADRVQRQTLDEPREERTQFSGIRQGRGIAAVGFDHPLAARHLVYCCAPPHSGQNLPVRGMGLPQLMQNLVPLAASGLAGAAGVSGAGGAADGVFIAFIMLCAIVRPAPSPTPIPAAPPPSFPAAMGIDCATWNCV